jgi:hypothetical protein
LKPGWTRFLASASALWLVSLAVTTAAQDEKKKSPSATRANELTLAGLRPGLDSSARAKRLYKGLSSSLTESNELSFESSCPKEKLTVELDGNHRVQTVRAGIAICDGDCTVRNGHLRTGRGLQLTDTANRVLRLYGKPDSRSPSTKDGQQLELLYYAFDWAGPDVPQVMEVLCTVGKNDEPGRVVEITLAASSL